MNPIRVRSLCLLPLVFGVGCDPGGREAPRSIISNGGEGNEVIYLVCDEGETLYEGECLVPAEIKLNTVGYLPERKKVASVPGSAGSDEFRVRNVDNDEVAFTGTLGPLVDNVDSDDQTRVADFTELTEPGTYRMEVEGLSDSPEFKIAPDVFEEPLRAAMLGFYGQRCGEEVSFDYQGNHFEHAACHLEDALTLEGEARDGHGGWHDAGDYGKYTVNAAFSLGFFFKAWEMYAPALEDFNHIPDYTEELPAWLAEAKVQVDQLLLMQNEDGGAAHMIGPASFPGFIRPESDRGVRHFSGVGTAATADLAAIAAIAARVYEPFDPDYAAECLETALRAEEFLTANPEVILPDFSQFTHSAYGGGGDSDDRFWAMVELWRTTGDDSRLAALEAAMPTSVPINWDWAGVHPLGVFDYAMSDAAARDPELVASITDLIVTSADTLVTNTNLHGYGRGLGTMYYWGVNGVIARSVMNLMVADALVPNDAYVDAAIQQIDHLLGRNPFGRSYVTGVGYFPANFPHHRPSAGDGLKMAWPGLLVGGPNPNNDSGCELADGLCWLDTTDDFTSNEVAINWNAALVYALAGMIPE